MSYKFISTGFLLFFSILTVHECIASQLVILSKSAVKIELKGYTGLSDRSLFQVTLAAGAKYQTDTQYNGLALLQFAGGQRYPVILGNTPLSIEIENQSQPPSFAGNGENVFFYKLLAGKEVGTEQYKFALLMMQAKQLLKSSHTIHTTKELAAKKKEFQEFIANHYQSLKHSDMVKRLLAQYFMMHEYVNYHVEGKPASDIKVKYQKAVLSGVASWLKILKPHLPDHDILNYCVSLYYNRSMVALASHIMQNFPEAAYCPGVEEDTFTFPNNLTVTAKNGDSEMTLADLKGTRIISIVSNDCPVSMAAAVSKARQLAINNYGSVIVVPLQELSRDHLAMGRMMSSKNMFFANDEKWRKENVVKKIKLPLFLNIDLPVGQQRSIKN